MSGLATPPPASSPALMEPAPYPAERLLALLDDSDDEKDAAPSFYYQPNLADSPEKPTSSVSNRVAILAPILNSPQASPSTDGEVPTTLRPSRTSLSRSTSTADPVPVREPRAFSRVASVPATILRSQRLVDTSPVEDSDQERRQSDGYRLDPETPAPPPTAPRRTFTTVSRPAFPSSVTRPRELPSVTPGLTSRYNALTSATSSKVLSVRRPGSNSTNTTPESDGVMHPKDQASSPDSGPSPRASPNGIASSALGYSRSRVASGRLGAAPPMRARKQTAAAVGALLEETDEDTPERRRGDELELELRRRSMERRERKEAERLRELEREREMESDVDREIKRERDMMVREREFERAPARYSPSRRDSDGNEYNVDDHAGNSSPTQREYGHIPAPPPPTHGRSRAASSSEHRLVSRPASSMSQHVDQRAASSLDHYASRQASGPSSSKQVPRVLRGVAPPTVVTTDVDPSRPRSRGRLQAAATEASLGSNLRTPHPPLARQGSAPAVSSGNMMTNSTATGTATALPNRHRRNPTDPSPPNRLRAGLGAADNADSQSKENAAVTWSAPAPNAAGYDAYQREEVRFREVTNRESAEQEMMVKEKEERERTIAQQRYSQSQQQAIPPAVTPQAEGHQQVNSRKMNHTIMVHRKAYQRLECIGRGGSSRVYRVVSPENTIYAIKRVSLENADQPTIEGYKNEIELLKRLEGNKRIIRLVEFDSSSKKSLLMVMECGEVDLARLLTEKQGEPVDFPWVTSYWQQMLQAVQVIHDEKIVHSDLKPANFVLVKGSLKLIDFGIAKAIPNDTTNIQREQQIGTVNYMSPEAIQGSHAPPHRLANGVTVMKLGRASDVWSLGCILYQMIYGQAPFWHLSMWQKMGAIPDPKHAIDFPAVAVPTVPGPRDPQTGQPGPPQRLLDHAIEVPPGIIATMRNCLQRDPKARPSIPELLAEKWNMNPAPEVPRSGSPTPFLQPDEAIINKNMMLQLMTYTLRSVPRDSTPEQLEEMVASLLPRLQEARHHHNASS